MNSTKKHQHEPIDTRDASLRVSKRTRDQLKMAAAVLGRPLYDVTTEAIENYLTAVTLRPRAASRPLRRKSP
jgi:hypothetical protein